MRDELGIHELVAAGRADSRYDKNIRKIGDIFCLIQVLYFGITARTRSRNVCLHAIIHRSYHGRS
jgi:hypothetical protein